MKTVAGKSDLSKDYTDAFGTVLHADEILAGISACGLRDATLSIFDQTLHLAVTQSEYGKEKAAIASTWLKQHFSPLMPISLVIVNEVDGCRIVDERKRKNLKVSLVEFLEENKQWHTQLEYLAKRLDLNKFDCRPASPNEGDSVEKLERYIRSSLTDAGMEFEINHLKLDFSGRLVLDHEYLDCEKENSKLQLLLWRRPAQGEGRAAIILAAAYDTLNLGEFVKAIKGGDENSESGYELFVDGLCWAVGRRPTIATAPNDESCIIRLYDDCEGCSLCRDICPCNCLSIEDGEFIAEPGKCIRCYDCIEACPKDALRPSYWVDTSLLGRTLVHRPHWLERLVGLPGPLVPASFPPSYLIEKNERDREPVYVLGLAITTMQEHAAVLLKDGRIVAAIEEERLNRHRHYGWQPEDRAGVTLAIDPTIAIEEAFCRRSIRAMLEEENIGLDDISIIALNGIPARYRNSYSQIDPKEAPLVLKSGKLAFIPHHLCHARSVYGLSGESDAIILSVDGRGDRETAVLFKGQNGELQPVSDILSLTDRSIGGVYETITRLLGFGRHGQGSVMALSCFGEAKYDLSDWLSVKGSENYSIREFGLAEAFVDKRRKPEDEIEDEHRDLAASLQRALEESISALLIDSEHEHGEAICLAGGVALNCKMNERLRRDLNSPIYVQPAANDAGTALGAALEALRISGYESIENNLDEVFWGADFSDDQIERELKRRSMCYSKPKSIAKTVAGKLAEGKVVCRFDGSMEFGPRALGNRSILADPSNLANKLRVNQMKSREEWRPFGPSILAGYEGQWFEQAFDSRFMLFTQYVREGKREAIPAVMHVDGTTRPQVVHADVQPEYYELLKEFHRLTGLPMLLNTSFNRRGEPIVCTPSDAVECFLDFDADLLAIGSFLVESKQKKKSAVTKDENLKDLSGGRRLMLRLTTKCDGACRHCTIKDIEGMQDRTFDESMRSLALGRKAGCDELVIMRGEATNRADLPGIIERARAMGYRWIQLQSHARIFAKPEKREKLEVCGIDSIEAMIWASNETIHDRLFGVNGAFRESLLGIRRLIGMGVEVIPVVPVVRENLHELVKVTVLAAKLGLSRIQFNFPRPVETVNGLHIKSLLPLSQATKPIGLAMEKAKSLGMAVSCEGLPLCFIAEEFHNDAVINGDGLDFRVDDLHVLHERLEEKKASKLMLCPPCRNCRLSDLCSGTWPLYLELVGSGELKPFR